MPKNTFWLHLFRALCINKYCAEFTEFTDTEELKNRQNDTKYTHRTLLFEE